MSIVVLCISLVTLTYLPEFDQRVRWHGAAFVRQATVAIVFTVIVGTAALVNLVKDVGRGYSPARCSLAAVILLFAFTPAALLTVQLFRYSVN